MEIGLSEGRIKDAQSKLGTLKSNIRDASKSIVDTLSKYGEVQAIGYNLTAPHSSDDIPQVRVVHLRNGYEAIVELFGKSAVYDEFGTGEEGASDGHPWKGQQESGALNPYNSGWVVRRTIDKDGRHYWVYKPMAGRPWYDKNGKTYGIPSGKQMYHTAMDIRRVKNEVVAKQLNEAIKGFNNLK